LLAPLALKVTCFAKRKKKNETQAVGFFFLEEGKKEMKEVLAKWWILIETKQKPKKPKTKTQNKKISKHFAKQRLSERWPSLLTTPCAHFLARLTALFYL
jgi:hypothetical protein